MREPSRQPSAVAEHPGTGHDVFVARQPIFDRHNRVFAYELLFRSSFENVCRDVSLSEAAGRVLSGAVLTFGLEELTGGRKAFVNFTEDHLLSGAAELLPPETTVIELLEHVEPRPEIVEVVRTLKRSGYLVALDDFVYRPELEPLVDLADIIKIAFRTTTPAERRDLAYRLLPRGVQLLAEQVETFSEIDEARRIGCVYFQGYFFRRPEVMTRREFSGYRLTYVQILRAIGRAELQYDEMEDIIRRDVSMSHKLLRYINSAWFGWRMEIKSIRHALVLLGERDVRRWVSLVALGGFCSGKPQELLVDSAVRARLCEALARVAGFEGREFDLFLLGAFSLIDAMLDSTMEQALAQMPIAADVKAALLGDASRLRQVLDLAVQYEDGAWEAFTETAAAMGLAESTVPPIHVEALAWAREAFRR